MHFEIEIESWRNFELIFKTTVECEDGASQSFKLGLAVRAAIQAKVSLQYADLQSADLRSVNLQYADLQSADLRSVNLQSVNLQYANLQYANLQFANLQSADLRSVNLQYANLQYANLQYANLQYADLRYACLPSPTVVLLSNWGVLSASLTADMMEYDAQAHPDRKVFDAWSAGGDCPYLDVRVQRAANFYEDKAQWGKGRIRGAYDLMLSLFAENEIKF